MEPPAENSSAPSDAARPRRRGARKLRLSPQACLVLAVLVLAVSTYAAVTQSLHPDAYRQSSVLSGDWWGYPFEWNPPARLAAVGRDLKDVYAVPDTNTVYAVGELGTVLVSTDDGRTWQRAADRTQAPAPTPSASPTPAASPTPTPAVNTNAYTNVNANANAGNTNAGNMNRSMNGNMNSGANANNRNAKADRDTNSKGASPPLLGLLDLVPTAAAAELRADDAREPGPQGLGTASGESVPASNAAVRPSNQTNRARRAAQNSPPGTRQTPSPTPPLSEASPAVVQVEDYPAPPVEGRTLAAVRFRNEREGFVVTDEGECFKTSDGAVNWSDCGDEETLLTDVLSNGAPPELADDFEDWGLETGLGWSVRRGDGGNALVRVKTLGKYPDTAVPLEQTGEAISSYALPDMKELFLINEKEVWGITEDGALLSTGDGERDWTFLLPPPSSEEGGFNSLCFTDRFRGWLVGDRGRIVTSDRESIWKVQREAREAEPDLRSVSFQPDGLRGWAVGDAGTILHTEDGGATWVHQAQRRGTGGRFENAAGGDFYFRLMPPWYYLSWVLVAFLLLPVRRTAVVDLEAEAEPSVADVLVSDRPLEEGDADTIDFKPIALGLSRFLRNENTKPPLTVAITGEWGTGKSSLMNLLRADLRRYDFRPVWFNAWHHQKEEHLLASLLQNVRLQAVPPLWRPEGLVFRARLLRIRGARHWGPVLLLVVFALVALFYWLLSGSSGNTYLAHAFRDVAALFNGGDAPRVGEAAKPYLALLPLLVSLVTGGVTLWRGAKAFGVNPASLMASMSRGVRVRDLDAQTSFRQRFASEFNDVTKALGARSMIVFIDDLDRCRPENVVETLEAVNFLVTSGDCFVVIGMARARVEPCVGLSFKDVAAEMFAEGETAAAAPRIPVEEVKAAGPGGEEEKQRRQQEEARRKRFEYARQYLDKLINIEVPVPVPTPEQSCGILVANARRAEEHSDAPRRPVWLRWLPAGAEALGRDYGRLLLWCAGFVLLLSGCYALGSFLARPVNVSEPTPQPTYALTPTPPPAPTPTPGVGATPTPRPAPAATQTPLPSPTPRQAGTPELIAGRRSVMPAAAPVLLVVLAVLWVGFWVLTRRPGLVVKDSPRFVDALTIWHPLVFARSSTPRSVKRFMNRVRYLAMRQRRQKDDPPAWRRLLRRFAATEETAAEGEKATLNNGAAPIPDELLVALAAIQHYKAGWLQSPGILFSAPSRTAQRAQLSDAGISTADWDLLQTVKGEHARKFGDWDVDKVAAARDEFLKISEGVQVN